MTDNKPQPGETIPGTCIIYRPPRDLWAEQGVYVASDNTIRDTTKQPPTEAEPKPFWKR